jgi:3D (Asp-Asp-Asp) domain-containing protein/uncharacterized protein YabE (DUF348 family)
MGVFSLGLLLPLGAGTATNGIAKRLVALTAPAGPSKHITLIRDGISTNLETHAATADDLLAENGIARSPEDALSVDPASPVIDGETVSFRAAVPLTVVVDGRRRLIRTAAPTVGAVLAAQGIAHDRHDDITPAIAAVPASDETVIVSHVDRWTETAQAKVPAPLIRRLAPGLAGGATRVLQAGSAGLREISYSIVRTADRRGTRRLRLAQRILRAPRPRIIAEGVGDFALSQMAERSIDGTLRLAGSALSMMATAYTAACSGCSGMTASGVRAGHGIVAVDPRVIPLGTRMYIPGYGKAVAGDTGGAIRGSRIDLGFNSQSDAMAFGRRAIKVYVLR